jgi:hypothetical protein
MRAFDIIEQKRLDKKPVSFNDMFVNGSFVEDASWGVAYHNFWLVINLLRGTEAICPLCGFPFSIHSGNHPFQCVIEECMFNTDMDGGG